MGSTVAGLARVQDALNSCESSYKSVDSLNSCESSYESWYVLPCRSPNRKETQRERSRIIKQT
jgi:hypothetical protein